MTFKLTPNLAREAIIGTQLETAAAKMATAVHERSAILAPKDTRALVNSGRIVRSGKATYKVIYGSSKVPYARRRHYENNKNPQTLLYLERAGDSVTRGNIGKYFK